MIDILKQAEEDSEAVDAVIITDEKKMFTYVHINTDQYSQVFDRRQTKGPHNTTAEEEEEKSKSTAWQSKEK